MDDYGLDVAMLEKNLRPASKVQNALPKASERATSLQGSFGVTSRLPSALDCEFGSTFVVASCV